MKKYKIKKTRNGYYHLYLRSLNRWVFHGAYSTKGSAITNGQIATGDYSD